MVFRQSVAVHIEISHSSDPHISVRFERPPDHYASSKKDRPSILAKFFMVEELVRMFAGQSFLLETHVRK
jgi:hypothetical protein